MIIKNLKQFLDITNVSRCTNKSVIDNYISYYNIVNDDLIADIYQVCGI